MEKTGSLLFIFFLLTTIQASLKQHNHMNGPGNVVISGTGNSANGRDNTFDGYYNHAEGNCNHFQGDANRAEGNSNIMSGLNNFA